MGLVGTALGWLGLNKFLLIGAALAAASAFGAGWYFATQDVENRLIAAQQAMYDKGVAAQRKYDAKQFADNKLDFAARMKILSAQKRKVITIEKEIKTLVPRMESCVVSPDAMKRLNDVVAQ